MEHLNIFYVFFTFCIGFFSLTISTIVFFKTKNKFLGYYLFSYFTYSLLVITTSLDLYFIINFTVKTKTIISLIRLICISSLYFLPLIIIFMIHYIFNIKNKLLKNIFFTIISVFSILLVFYTHKENITKIKFYFSSFFNISEIIFFILIIYMLSISLFNYKKVENKEIKKVTKHAIILLIIFLPGIINDFFNYLKLPPGIYFFPLHYCCLSIMITIYITKNYFKLSRKGYFPQNIIEKINEDFLSEYRLSSREKEIFLLIINGYSNKNIADELFISISTVKKHIYSIFKKTNIGSRFELLRLIKNKI